MALLSPPTFGVFSKRAVVDSRRLARQTTSLCIGQRCLILTCSFPWKRKSLDNARWCYRLRHVVASSGDDSGEGSPSSSNDGDDLSSDSIKEEGQLLEKLSQVEAKQEEIVSAIVREKDFVESELEAVQSLYEQKLQESLAENSALESKLARVRQEAFDFAIQVEKMAELALKETTEFVLEDAQHRVLAAETSVAEMVLQFEEQVRIATENAIASVVDHSKEAIQKALDASEKAGGRAAKALATYNEVIDPVNEVSSLQSENIRLEVAITDLESKLLLSKNELEKLKLELEGAHAQANAAEIRAQNIEKALLEFQELNKKTSLEKEDEINSMVEKMRIEVEDKNRHTVDAFKTELESIKVVVNAAKETTVSRDNAFISRCEALKRSLKASDFAVKTWKQRAESAESLLFKDKSETQDDDDSLYLINGGRIDLLTDNESQKWKLLSDGPRKEIPQWLATRIASIRPMFPPRKYDLPENFEPSLRLLELPKVDEVWSIAQEKTRDGDVLIDHVIEKEILEKKKKALERIIDKTASRWKKTPEEMRTEPGTGTGREIVFQAFNWESWRRQWYLELAQKAADLSQTGITALWFPPPTESVAPQGYMPSDLYNLNSAYGSVDELKGCIEQMHTHNLLALGDVVLNHRCAHKQSPNGVWNIFGGKLAWGPEAIVCDDPHFQGRGNPSSGDFFHAAPNVDHSQEFVRRDIKEWLNWLKTEIGFDGWRLDFVRGFSGTYVKEYIESSHPAFAIGEYWDSLAYENGNLCYNQDAHRQRLVHWINATGGTSSAFDVTTKGILHSALHNEYWRLIDPQGKPTGVMGWWPSRAVTFLENHDTGSTQGHWPFPRDKLGQGYAYILTHPGTPAIFYDHFYDFGMHETISELVDARRRAGIHCRSVVKIYHANKEGYVAKVGETLVMKIGHFHWNPSKENQLDGSWQMFLDKRDDYQIWLRV